MASGGLEGGCGAGTQGHIQAGRSGLRQDLEWLKSELLPLILWEDRAQRSQGECTGRATFHLQPVKHGAAVHHIQHRSAGLQAGEDLEDKGGWAREELQEWAACGASQSQPSASRTHRHRPSTSTSRTSPLPRAWAAPGARPRERAPALSTGWALAPVTSRPRPQTMVAGGRGARSRVCIQLACTSWHWGSRPCHPTILT